MPMYTTSLYMTVKAENVRRGDNAALSLRAVAQSADRNLDLSLFVGKLAQ